MTDDRRASPSTARTPPEQRWRAARGTSRTAVILGLVLVAAAAVRLSGIGDQSYSIDEIGELRIAEAGISEIWGFDDGIPPLYSLLLRLVLPLGDLSGRVLSALFGVGTVALAWGLGRRVAGARVGLWAAGMVAFSPVAIHISQEGRAHSLFALIAAAWLWSLWVALDEPSRLGWIRWGVLSALGLYTQYLFGVLIVAALVVILVRRRARPWRGLAIGLGTGAVLAAPVLAIVPGDLALQLTESAGVGFRPAEVLYAGYTLLAGFSLGAAERELHYLGVLGAVEASWVWIALLVPVAAVLSVQGFRALGDPHRLRLLVFSLCSVALITLTMLASGNPLAARYLAWLVVPVAVWAAAGLLSLGPVWRWTCIAVLAAVAVSGVVARNLDPHHQTDDFRSVAAYLETSGALDHPVLVTDPNRVRPIVYYFDRARALALPDTWDPDVGRLGYCSDADLGLIPMPPSEAETGLAEGLAWVDASTEPGALYYVIYARAFHSESADDLLDTLRARDGLALAQAFTGLDLYRGERSP